jgi:hypothetical protein
MAPLYHKIATADALVVGFPVYFGHANAFTHTFLERLFALRHVRMLTQGELAAVVAVGGHEAEKVSGDISYRLENCFEYRVVGSVFFNSATPPCFICGYGTTCRYGGPARWLTPEEFKNLRITPEMFQRFEDHPMVVEACEGLSSKLRIALGELSP